MFGTEYKWEEESKYASKKEEDAVTKEPTVVPKETSAVTEDSECKTKVHVLSVHKQFILESVEDANGIKT